MDAWLSAAVLGVVEGLTEFLPVSSTGHLILVGHAIGFTGPRAESFEVVIQLGAILAVVVLYWRRFAGLVLPPAEAPEGGGLSGRRGIGLLALTTLPACVAGLAAAGTIKAHLFNPQSVAWALGVGALAILAVEALRRPARLSSLDQITPALALGIGLFQCLALWPGFSRSAATIMGGMLLGADRRVAAEYSFIAAVPVMGAATGYELLSSLGLFSAADLPVLAIGFGVSFLAAWAAVKGFIGLLTRMTLRPFAAYRLALAPLVLLFWT